MVKNKYQQGYIAGIKYARAKFEAERIAEVKRVRWACGFWVVVAVMVSSFIF